MDGTWEEFNRALRERLRALCRPEVYSELVEESGWSPDEYESWLCKTLKEQLLPREALYP